MSHDNLYMPTEAEGGVLFGHKYARYSYPSAVVERGVMQFHCSTRIGVRSNGSSGMDDRDKRIYNSLGDSSGSKGKVVAIMNPCSPSFWTHYSI